jgi:hypothetical protein
VVELRVLAVLFCPESMAAEVLEIVAGKGWATAYRCGRWLHVLDSAGDLFDLAFLNRVLEGLPRL